MKKLLREPLVHFVLLGVVLFICHGIWERWVSKTDYTVVISPEEIQRQAAIFMAENNRGLTESDKQGLIFAHKEEQVLMREALRLGLDEDDTIIRRRLAQKMRFMLTEDTPPPAPDDAELEKWFEVNKAKFALPTERAFSHIYYSPGEHENVEAAAKADLSLANSENWQTLGNPFIEQRQFSLINQSDLTRKMGHNFARAIFELPYSADWQGPIESSFGLHLVRLDGRTVGRMPTFEQAKEEITFVWQEQALRAANQQRLADVLNKYEVVVPEAKP